MGLKATVRTIEADVRKVNKHALRQQHEFELKNKKLKKMQAIKPANSNGALNGSKIKVLTTFHQICGNKIDWKIIQATPSPPQPHISNKKELFAKKLLESYRPTLLDKLFQKVEGKRAKMIINIENAKMEDEIDNLKAHKEYEEKSKAWEKRNTLATKILNGDTDAYEEAITLLNPFREIKEIGLSLKVDIINEYLIDVTLEVNNDNILPVEIKNMQSNGSYLPKQLIRNQYFEIYQDYVCSCILRIARELFMLLPIKAVTITAVSELLNTQTGYMEKKPILSVFIPGDTLKSLNFSLIDPTDAMDNFIHNMNFRRSKGFMAVEKIKPPDIHVDISNSEDQILE